MVRPRRVACVDCLRISKGVDVTDLSWLTISILVAVLIAATVIVWRVAKAGGSVKLWGGIKIDWGDKK